MITRENFEFNDIFIRRKILNSLNSYLSEFQQQTAIEDFKVICDKTNNTSDIISKNEVVVDIFIKPQYQAEYVKLVFNNVGINEIIQ